MNPPILTKDELATPQMWRAELDGKGINPASHYAVCLKATKQAIATGTAVVVPVISEAQAREAFEAWANSECPTTNFHRTPHGDYYVIGLERDWRAWTAALRHSGVLK